MSINNNIRNYYERLVVEEVLERLGDAADADHLTDIACVALNRLPPRYIRHEVDMAFYMSPDELHEINHRINEAVTNAIEFVAAHGRDDSE